MQNLRQPALLLFWHGGLIKQPPAPVLFRTYISANQRKLKCYLEGRTHFK